MSCEEFEARMDALLDGEGGDDAAALQEHPHTCPRCAARLAAADRLRGALRRSAAEDAPERARLRALIAVARAAAERGRVREEPPAILTLAEVAEYLRVREEDVRRMLYRIPHFVVGDQVRFRRQSVEAWIEHEERRRSTSVFTHPSLTLLSEEGSAWPLTG